MIILWGVLADRQGILIAVVVAGTNGHDMNLLNETWEAVTVNRARAAEEAPQHLCADKGYDYTGIR